MIWLQVYTLTIHTYLTTQSDSSIPDICNKMMLKLIVLPCVMLSVLGNYIESRMGKKLKYRPKLLILCSPIHAFLLWKNCKKEITESRWGRQIAEVLWSRAILNTSLKMNSPLLQLWEVFLSLQIKQHKPYICILTNESNKSFPCTTAREGATEESLDWARISKWWEFHITRKSTVRLICFGFTNKLPDGAYTWLGNYLFLL